MAFVTTLLAIIGLAVGLVVIATYRARRRRRGAYRNVEGHVLTATAGTDDDVRAALRRDGADLTKPHAVRCFLTVPTQPAAERVAMLLGSHGFTDVRTDARDDGWGVYATTSMVPDTAAMATLRADLDGLAQSVGGTCEGWSADPVR